MPAQSSVLPTAGIKQAALHNDRPNNRNSWTATVSHTWRELGLLLSWQAGFDRFKENYAILFYFKGLYFSVAVEEVSFSPALVHLSLYVLVKCKHLGLLCFYLQGYSFMAPSILFKRNVVMDDPVQLCGGSEKPGSAAVARSAMMKVKWMDLVLRAQTHLS